MTNNQIKGALIATGSNQSRIAESLNLSSVSVWHVINRKYKSKRIAQAIANQINKPLEVVFPEYKNHKPRAVKK